MYPQYANTHTSWLSLLPTVCIISLIILYPRLCTSCKLFHRNFGVSRDADYLAHNSMLIATLSRFCLTSWVKNFDISTSSSSDTGFLYRVIVYFLLNTLYVNHEKCKKSSAFGLNLCDFGVQSFFFYYITFLFMNKSQIPLWYI